MAVEDLPFPFRLSWGALIMQSSVQLNFDRLDGLVDKLKNIAQKSVHSVLQSMNPKSRFWRTYFKWDMPFLDLCFNPLGAATLDRPLKDRNSRSR